MNKIYELGSRLEGLLSTLKKNRENVPLEMLKTYYQKPYDALIQEINQVASAFAKKILIENLIINPHASIEEQLTVIQRTIDTSGMLKQMGKCISTTYSAQELHGLVLKLRKQVELALWPYVNLETCLVGDLNDPEKEPVIYNTLTHQIYENGRWIDQEFDLFGKILVYCRQQSNNANEKENNYDNTNCR